MIVELKDHPNPYKFPCKFYADPEFPPSLIHNHRMFWKTGKVGVSKDGIPSAEYSRFHPGLPIEERDWRVWLDANDNLSED